MTEDKNENNTCNIAKQLEGIKKLLVLQLVLQGVTSDSIASALGVDGSTVRRMVSSTKIKGRKAPEDK